MIVQLDHIAFLIKYINGNVEDDRDDIIRPSKLYDYICRILDKIILEDGECSEDTLKECIAEETKDYEEKVSGAARRLQNALEIIIIAYYASIIKKHSDSRIDELMKK